MAFILNIISDLTQVKGARGTYLPVFTSFQQLSDNLFWVQSSD